MATKARGEDNRLWVIYSDVFEPLDYGGWPIEVAFSNLLKHIGYEPAWRQEMAETLELNYVGGGKINPTYSENFSPFSNPRFCSALDRSQNPQWFARNRLMTRVLIQGLYGWRGEIRYQYLLDRNVAEQRKRNPELHPRTDGET